MPTVQYLKCGMVFREEDLYCPLCGAFVIPQASKTQTQKALDAEVGIYKTPITWGFRLGLGIGLVIVLVRFFIEGWPSTRWIMNFRWVLGLALFPVATAALGMLPGALVGYLRDQRRRRKPPTPGPTPDSQASREESPP